VAMFKDMGLPWEPEVKSAVQAQRKVFESLGCIVEDAEPDFSDANEAFLAWRHWSIELGFGDLLATHGDQLNEYIHWHVEEGRKLTGPYLSRIEAKRTALYQRLCNFKGEYEFFILPVNQVLPFDVNTHYPTEIAGVKMENYLAWMKSAYYISAAGNPAMSVPCAFSSSGLPIGMQIVGRHHDDWGVLQLGVRVRTGHQHRALLGQRTTCEAIRPSCGAGNISGGHSNVAVPSLPQRLLAALLQVYVNNPQKEVAATELQLVLLCLLLIFFLSPACSLAQSTFGSIVGTVKDASGALVPGASVKLTNSGTGAERTVITDQHGDYSFLNLNPGRYQVTVYGEWL
jgi:hypothetical protein